MNLVLHPLLFLYKTILTYEIELPSSGNKVGFNLLDGEDSIIPYITNTIPNSPAGCQLPSRAKQNLCIIAINGKDLITAQGDLDELNSHQPPRVKTKVEISLFRRKSYQRTYFEDICSRFDQVGSVVSHIRVIIPRKPPTLENIGEVLKVPQRQF